MATHILNEIRVLKAFRPFLSILNAYNWDKFHYGANWRSNPQNIFYAFSSTMIVFLLPATVILLFWYLIEISVSFGIFLVELPIAISILQMEVIFIALLLKNRTVTTTIQRLQQIIDQRKCVWFLQSLRKCPQCKFPLIPIGCAESKQSYQIYKRSEEKHTFITTILTKVSVFSMSTLVLLPVMFPVSYGIFGYPPPQLWILPLDTQ